MHPSKHQKLKAVILDDTVLLLLALCSFARRLLY